MGLSELGPFEGVALRLSGIREGEAGTGVGFEREKNPLEGGGREVSPGARRFLEAAALDDISKIRAGSGCHMIGTGPGRGCRTLGNGKGGDASGVAMSVREGVGRKESCPRTLLASI